MDFALTPEQQEFGKEFGEYLEKTMTPELKKEKMEIGESGGPECLKFWKVMGKDGWLGVGWPTEYGGQGRTALEQHIFFETADYYDAPLPIIALNTVGPTIQKFGTQEQKDLVLPAILRGEVEIAIGYSEPDAGSDLSSLQATAVKDGDDYILNGQKSFTSLAHFAKYIWFAARTDPDAPKKSKGISIFLVDIDSPGIDIVPLHTMGKLQTNSTFYDNVRVPGDRLIGEENKGWKYITNQLDLERIALCTSSPLRRRIDKSIEFAKETMIDGKKIIDRPGVKAKLAELTADVEVLKLLNFQVAMKITNGEMVYAEASTVKSYGSVLYQKVNNVLLEIFGPLGLIQNPHDLAPLEGEVELGYRADIVYIFGGGAIEVQKTIIAMAGMMMPMAG